MRASRSVPTIASFDERTMLASSPAVASAARSRSVTSRRITVSSVSPSPARICEIDASTGNSSPFARRPQTCPSCPMRRLVCPERAKRSMCSRCAERNRSGISASSGRPTTSALLRPNIFSAAGLNSTTRCASSTETIASIAECTMPASRDSLSRRFASAARSSVTSMPVPITRAGVPSGCWTTAFDHAMRRRPPVFVSQSFSCRLERPVLRNSRNTCSISLRCSSGISRQTGWPTTSAAANPVARSQAALKRWILASRSSTTTSSEAASRTAVAAGSSRGSNGWPEACRDIGPRSPARAGQRGRLERPTDPPWVATSAWRCASGPGRIHH